VEWWTLGVNTDVHPGMCEVDVDGAKGSVAKPNETCLGCACGVLVLIEWRAIN